MSIKSADDLLKEVKSLQLFDHHCHGIVTEPLQRPKFEELISESSSPAAVGTTRFDSQIGFQVRGSCAPIIGLSSFCSPSKYIDKRATISPATVNAKFLEAAGIKTFGLETGHSADTITTPDELNKLTGKSVYEIVRLEKVAEEVAEKIRNQDCSDRETAFLKELDTTLQTRINNAIGVKSIAAYRIGLDFSPARPTKDELSKAVANLLAQDGEIRLEDSTIIRYLLWFAIDTAQVIQLHIGYGDDDVDLHRCNPLLLTDLFRESSGSGARFTLLHCYPFHREAGYLADVFPHVYFDVGLAINYTGARAQAVIAESLEVSPFGKILFSSDAYGLPELYYLGAKLFREGLTKTLYNFHQEAGWPLEEGYRIARMISYENAERLYKVGKENRANE